MKINNSIKAVLVVVLSAIIAPLLFKIGEWYLADLLAMPDVYTYPWLFTMSIFQFFVANRYAIGIYCGE